MAWFGSDCSHPSPPFTLFGVGGEYSVLPDFFSTAEWQAFRLSKPGNGLITRAFLQLHGKVFRCRCSSRNAAYFMPFPRACYCCVNGAKDFLPERGLPTPERKRSGFSEPNYSRCHFGSRSRFMPRCLSFISTPLWRFPFCSASGFWSATLRCENNCSF